MAVRINGHGLFGAVCIIIMLAIAFLRDWEIEWLWYFAGSVIIYGLTVIILTLVFEDYKKNESKYYETETFTTFRPLMGSHCAFVFLLIGALLPLSSRGVMFGYFLASVAAGLALPFLVIKPPDRVER